MRQYLISIISAAVLSAVAQTVSPNNWTKYINIITGIMIVSVIAAPVFEISKIDLFSDFSYSYDVDEYAQKKAVITELEKKVSEDAANRLKNEFSWEFKVNTMLDVNENYEIESVKEMTVWPAKEKKRVKAFLQKIYSPQKILFQN